jgi:hypothetical protein
VQGTENILWNIFPPKLYPQLGNISQNTRTNFRLFHCIANQVYTNSGNEFITSADVNAATLRFLSALLFSDVN